MSFTYENFYLSGFNTGTLVSGIQAKTPLYCIVSGLKYGGSPVTSGHYEYFTGVFLGVSGNLTVDVSGYLGFSSTDDDYRGVVVLDDTSGLYASGCLELYWNSGDINTSTGIVLPSGFELFNNFDQTAWNIVTKKNGSINNADSQHTHSAYAQYLRDLDDVGLPAAIDDGDALIYNAASGGWTTGAGGGDPDDWTAVSGEVAEITGTVYDYTVFSGAFSVTSGAVADYPTLSGSYSSLSGAISDYSFVSGSHAALSGDYNAVSGVIDDYVVFSGAFSALSGTLPGHISDNNAHHRPTKINDTPTNGETTTGASSNWAYDHKVIFETASGALNTMSGAVADYGTVSGSYATTSGAVADYPATSGDYVTTSGVFASVSGVVNDYEVVSGSYVTTSGNYVATSGNYVATSGDYVVTSGDYVATSGSYVVTSGAWAAKQYKINGELPSDGNYNGIISNVDTAEGTFGDLLWLSGDGNYYKAGATGTVRMLCTAIFLASNTVLHYGTIREDDWNWTPGARLYVSGLQGKITPTPTTGIGDFIQVIGHALTADSILFNPANDWVEATGS